MNWSLYCVHCMNNNTLLPDGVSTVGTDSGNKKSWAPSISSSFLVFLLEPSASESSSFLFLPFFVSSVESAAGLYWTALEIYSIYIYEEGNKNY